MKAMKHAGKKASMRYYDEANGNENALNSTPTPDETVKERGPFQFEEVLEMKMRALSSLYKDNALQVAKYIDIKKAPGRHID